MHFLNRLSLGKLPRNNNNKPHHGCDGKNVAYEYLVIIFKLIQWINKY